MLYGWRARVGHVSPAIIDTSAEECRKLLPEGVLHVGLSVSQPVQRMAPDELEQAGTMIVDAARRLAAEECDVIVAGGAPATSRLGPPADEALIAAMREATGLPCTTASTAVVEALRALGLRRVALVSPFVDARNEEAAAYLGACGISVAAMRGLGIQSNVAIAKLPATVPYQMARAIVREAPDVDGIYIACPRWPVVDVIAAIETDLRKPVVAGVTAMMWHALHLIGIGDPPRGFGRLMDTLRA